MNSKYFFIFLLSFYQVYVQTNGDLFDGEYRFGCYKNKCWADDYNKDYWCFTTTGTSKYVACELDTDCKSNWNCSKCDTCLNKWAVEKIIWLGDWSNGCFFKGASLTSLIVKNVQDCKKQCKLAGDCTHYHYQDSVKKCWLKEGLVSKTNATKIKDNVVCGIINKE
jgi:hypothetical protein